MWFSKKEQTVKRDDASQILASLLSNGINLSIEELIQYQGKTSLINLTARKNLHGKMSGNYLARSKGRGMEFDEVRQYQPGDDIRTIDWRVTARTGKTHTKLFKEEVERPVLIATDLSASMLFGSQLLFKSVQAAHLASLVAWHAKARGDRIGGIVFNHAQHTELKPRSRQQGVLHYLHALVQLHASSVQQNLLSDNSTTQSASGFEENCARIRQLAKPGSLVYLLTDGHQINEQTVRPLAQISRHCELVVCLISDPLEQQLPISNQKINLAITDGVHRQQITLGDDNIAATYQQKNQQMIQDKKDLLTKAGARLLSFSANTPLEVQLKNGVTSWSR